MTDPFVQAVAQALGAQILAARVPHDGWCQPLADQLAPNVAAAIAAGGDLGSGKSALGI